MKEVSIVGLDLAKRVFQAHGVGTDGGVVFRRKLSRSQVLGATNRMDGRMAASTIASASAASFFCRLTKGFT